MAKLFNRYGFAWGGDYTGSRRDYMHMEFMGTPAQAATATALARRELTGTPPTPPTGKEVVLAMQRALNFVGTEVDGIWGNQTERGVNTIRNAINGVFPYGVKEAQTRVGATADGSWGPASVTALNIAILALGAISVLGAGNLPSGVWKYTKLYVSAATAGLVVLASFLTDGVTTTEWLQVGIAVLGALGVIAAPGPLVLPQPLGRHQAT
jgi:hypothetical protein